MTRGCATHAHTHTNTQSLHPSALLLIRITPLNKWSLLLLFPLPLGELSLLLLSPTMSLTCAVPLQQPPQPPTTKSLYSNITLPLFLEKRSLCPLVSYSPRCVRISRYHRHPCPHHHHHHHPLHPTPALQPPTPTCAYAEEEGISTVAAAKHHTTKEMHTSDSNHQEGR